MEAVRWLLLCVLSAGCYGPTPPQGVPCGDGASCPTGQRCFDGFCSLTAPATDGPDGSDSSTPPGDAAPPVTLRFGERPDALEGTWFDTFLEASSNQAANNFGNHPDLHLTASEVQPVLIRVDLSSVPAGATVLDARLHLFLTFGSIPADTRIQTFAINEEWSEGTGDHSPGIANQFDRIEGFPWSEPGAAPPSRSASADATTTIPALTEEFGSELVIELTSALVASWVANEDAAARGIAMIVDANDFYGELGSSEHSEADLRPFLELQIQP